MHLPAKQFLDAELDDAAVAQHVEGYAFSAAGTRPGGASGLEFR